MPHFYRIINFILVYQLTLKTYISHKSHRKIVTVFNSDYEAYVTHFFLQFSYMQVCLILELKSKFLYNNSSQQYMAIYFKMSCFSPQRTKLVVIVCIIITGLLAAVHFGYCKPTNDLNMFFKSSYYQNIFIDPYITLMQSILAYLIVVGVVQVFTCLLVLLLAVQTIGTTFKEKWIRAALVSLILSLALNVGVGVSIAIIVNFTDKSFNGGINASNPTEFQLQYNSDWRNFIRYGIAESVISFLLIVPLLMILIISLVNQIEKQEVQVRIQEEVTRAQIPHPN